ncbi:MAG: DUF6636 domain-containing protein [Mycobacterium sp.]
MRPLSLLVGSAALGVFAAPVAAADLESFTSPSGNIGCIMDAEYLRCDIAEREWSPPPRPTDCPSFTGYGQGISMDPHGPAAFVCAGDTTLHAGPALGYGQTQRAGGFTCASDEAGVRCANADGHGFRLSRQSYSIF